MLIGTVLSSGVVDPWAAATGEAVLDVKEVAACDQDGGDNGEPQDRRGHAGVDRHVRVRPGAAASIENM